MQLKINKYNDIVFEWIPYNQLKNIKKVGRDSFAITYLAIWKDGPLYYNKHMDTENYIRLSNEKVTLKCIHNSQDVTVEVLREVRYFLNDIDHL